MSGKAELEELFLGILDEPPVCVGDNSTPTSTPSKQPDDHVEPRAENKEQGHSSVELKQSMKGSEASNKREYHTIPPDATDVVGTPVKKAKIMDVDSYKYKPVESALLNQNTSTPSDKPHPGLSGQDVTQPGETFSDPMDVDADADADAKPRNHGPDPDNSNKLPSNPHSHSVILDPPSTMPSTLNIKKDDMQTIKEGSEPDNTNTEDLTSPNLALTEPTATITKPESSIEKALPSKLTLNTKTSEGVINAKGNAEESKSKDSDLAELQRLGRMLISNPRAFRHLHNEPRSKPSSSSSFDLKRENQPTQKANPFTLNSSSSFNDEHEDQAVQKPNPRRPKYDYSLPVIEGIVNWWSNDLGKGQIMERGTNEVRTINYYQIKPHYGALHTGVSVMYQWEYGDFQKFWVQQGMAYVLYDEAYHNLQKYPYMKHEH